MKVRSLTLATVMAISGVSMSSWADINAVRAQSNYQILCQGCHTPDGIGGRGVPRLTNSIGRFLQTQDGREYIVRVPGAANSPLDNTQLAELLNWSIEQFAGDSLPERWRYYTAEEVAKYRQIPLFEVFEYRDRILEESTAKQR